MILNLENRIGVLYLDSLMKFEYLEINFLLLIIRLMRKMFFWKLGLVFVIFILFNYIGVISYIKKFLLGF